MKAPKTCKCGGKADFSRYCAADVCHECGNHIGLSRCYCGWSESGRNGYTELLELGEVIEPEDY
jgi:hypothetical protein